MSDPVDAYERKSLMRPLKHEAKLRKLQSILYHEEKRNLDDTERRVVTAISVGAFTRM